MPRAIPLCFCLVSCTGLLASLAVHVVAFAGLNPEQYFGELWLVELALFFLMLPLALELFRRGWSAPVLGISTKSWKYLSILLLYYGIHFYTFVARAVDHLSPSTTWLMFSAGWILLFGLCGTFYLEKAILHPGQVTNPNDAP